ncbi:hypothetical protein [Phage Phass-1]|uniref:Uncharacterized protein n=1 Tax=Phage Phass-1 TaxID=3043662 RepID=A0AAF0LW90_9CAUD|nr:hypothetical protein [Phage Phass-1]
MFKKTIDKPGLGVVQYRGRRRPKRRAIIPHSGALVNRQNAQKFRGAYSCTPDEYLLTGSFARPAYRLAPALVLALGIYTGVVVFRGKVAVYLFLGGEHTGKDFAFNNGIVQPLVFLLESGVTRDELIHKLRTIADIVLAGEIAVLLDEIVILAGAYQTFHGGGHNVTGTQGKHFLCALTVKAVLAAVLGEQVTQSVYIIVRIVSPHIRNVVFLTKGVQVGENVACAHGVDFAVGNSVQILRHFALVKCAVHELAVGENFLAEIGETVNDCSVTLHDNTGAVIGQLRLVVLAVSESGGVVGALTVKNQIVLFLEH